MFKHSNIASCMFMAPDREEEEHEILVDKRVKWTGHKPSKRNKKLK